MIVITCPGFSLHGGIRIVLEWANRLDAIILNVGKGGRPEWFKLKPSIQITNDINILRKADVLIITSPHSIHLQSHRFCPKNVFIFMQMAEHLFRPTNRVWKLKCKEFYTSHHPMICISKWNHEECIAWGRKAPTYYVGNGVNFDDFPIVENEKDGKMILLESPMPSNPSKDSDHLALKVAAKLKKEFGVRVIAYGTGEIYNGYAADTIDHYYRSPDLKTLNDLYTRAAIMIKATKFDARSTSPIEAMTKGTVTARAIIKGDDDLINDFNCLRCDYNELQLHYISRNLLILPELRERLSKDGIEYVRQFGTWDYWIPKIKSIIEGKEEAKKLLI